MIGLQFSQFGCDNTGDWLLVKGAGYAPSLASRISPFKMNRVICLCYIYSDLHEALVTVI